MKTLAFVMDPLSGVQPSVDTSFAFMLSGQAHGYRIVHVAPRDIALQDGSVWLRGHIVTLKDQSEGFATIQEQIDIKADDISAIFVRTDPPFDEAYLNVSWLLSFAEEAGTKVINSPRGLREANEHLYALYFPELCPETLVSSNAESISAFVERVGGAAIAKPIDGHAGFAVVKLATGDSNLRALVGMLTKEGTEPTMVQRYLPEVSQGDKRLILIDGEVMGAVARVPTGGDHRGNVHVGGKVQASEITDRDREIVTAMAPRLKKDGLRFVGIDVIGDYLIEVNVTSPTLVREIESLGGPNLAEEMIERI